MAPKNVIGHVVIRPGAEWKPQTPDGFTDVGYDTADGIAKITIRRPEVRNAFRPRTLFELRLYRANSAAQVTWGNPVRANTGPSTLLT